jgi:antitoxin component YwqK of YwqJK toxin-antitoxin module
VPTKGSTIKRNDANCVPAIPEFRPIKHWIYEEDMKIARVMLTFLLILLPLQFAIANETNFDCSQSFCGCWTDVVITYEATIVNSNLVPQPDIQVFCLNQLNTILGTTDATGKIRMNISTSVSPGCGLGCDVLRLVKETSTTFDAWSSEIKYPKEFKENKAKITDGIIILNRSYQKGERKNGVYDGAWQEWCASRQWGFSGKLRLSGNYKNGLKEGLWTEYYCAGEKQMETTYKNGKKNGPYTQWYANGQTKQQGEWHDDHFNGKWTSWYPDGRLEEETQFHDDKRYGVSTQYRLDGSKVIDVDGRVTQQTNVNDTGRVK